MDPNTIENDVILQGYLKKYTGYLTGWRERHFTLKEGGILNFVDKQQGKDKGTIHLKIATIKLTPKDPLKITIHSGLKELNLRASSIIDKYRWVSALREAAYPTQDTMHSSTRSPQSKRNNSQLTMHTMSYSGHESYLNTEFKKIFDYENQILKMISYLLEKTLPKECEEQVANLNTVFKDMMKCIVEWKDAIILENERLERMKEKLDNYFEGLDGVRINVDDGIIKPDLGPDDSRPLSALGTPIKYNFGQPENGVGSSMTSELEQAKPAAGGVHTSDKILSIPEYDERKEEKPNLLSVKLSPIKHTNKQQAETQKSKRDTISIPEIMINGKPDTPRHEKEEHKKDKNIEEKKATRNDISEDEEQFYSIVNPALSKMISIKTINNDKTMEGGTMFQTVNEDDMQSFAHEDDVKFQNLGNNDLQVLQYLTVPVPGAEPKITKELNPQIQKLLNDNVVFKGYDVPYSSTRNNFPFGIKPASEQNWSWINNKTILDIPISYHEPLSFLQRLCEQFEYSELLDQSDELTDPLLKMAYVVAFIISGYHTTSRRLTKPMDSFLGETFEFCSEDNNFKFVAEQMSVSPAMTSFCGSSDHFELNSMIGLRPQFLGKCIEVKAEGHSEIKLKKTGDTYIYSRPITSIDFSLSGKYSITSYGEVRFRNTKTQESATVNLIKKGRDETKINVLEGYIKNAKGEFVYKIMGKWDEEIKIEHLETKKVTEIWKRKIMDNVDKNFGFTHFALQLNYLNKEMMHQLPPTDSRFRPDIRALENGDYELANTENQRLKEKNEKLLRDKGQRSSIFKPRWFDVINQENENFYTFNHKYFDEKLNEGIINELYD